MIDADELEVSAGLRLEKELAHAETLDVMRGKMLACMESVGDPLLPELRRRTF